MTIATRCRECHQAFDGDRAAILAGAWRLCPTCREAAQMPLEGAEMAAPGRCLRCHGAIALSAVFCDACRPAGPGGLAA